MYSFSACMTSKISQLKFEAHKFERVQWSCIKPFEKNKWSRAPNFPIRSSGGPNIIIAKVSFNLPIASSKGPQINVPLRHHGPNFPFSSSGHLSHHDFPIASPLRHQMANGPIFHCAIKGPQFPHHVIKMMISNFPPRYQGVPFSIASSRGLPFPPSRHQNDPNFQNTP